VSGDRLLLRGVDIDGRRVDCRIHDRVIEAIARDLDPPDVGLIIDGGGGALLPGLADHHLHLFAMAAAAASIDVSGDRDLGRLPAAVESARQAGQRLRVIGWDPQRHGDLDRDQLDRLGGDTPVRVQHRSGALWVLNSAALARLPLAKAPAGVERDAALQPTGRVWRADGWLRTSGDEVPDLGAVGGRLAQLGITAVTDATPDLDEVAVSAVADAMSSGALPQRVQLLGATVVPQRPERLTLGPRKLVVADHEFPDPDAFASTIAAAHEADRAVAVHCVSRAALALTIAALGAAGVRRGDRIEHCAVADLGGVAELRRLGVIVVTQPSLMARRGDDYLDRHPPDEHSDLWRYGSLLREGICAVASSDAPYGDADPWATMRAADDRRTAGGRVAAATERVAPESVLAGLLAPIDDPAAAPRRVAVGERADLVLLDRPVGEALARPAAQAVAATIADGRLVYGHHLGRSAEQP
jgi:predicted amidohydrolase YtcJ